MKKIFRYMFIGIFLLFITGEYSFGFIGYEKSITMKSNGETEYTYTEFKEEEDKIFKDCNDCQNQINIEELNIYNRQRFLPGYYQLPSNVYYPIFSNRFPATPTTPATPITPANPSQKPAEPSLPAKVTPIENFGGGYHFNGGYNF